MTAFHGEIAIDPANGTVLRTCRDWREYLYFPGALRRTVESAIGEHADGMEYRCISHLGTLRDETERLPLLRLPRVSVKGADPTRVRYTA